MSGLGLASLDRGNVGVYSCGGKETQSGDEIIERRGDMCAEQVESSLRIGTLIVEDNYSREFT